MTAPDRDVLYVKRGCAPTWACDLRLHHFPDCHAAGETPVPVEAIRDSSWRHRYRVVLPNGRLGTKVSHVCWICHRRKVKMEGLPVTR